MSEEEFKKLIDRYLANQLSDKEEQWMEEFFNSYNHNSAQSWDVHALGNKELLREELLQSVNQEIGKKQARVVKLNQQKILRYFSAAVVLLVCSLVYYWTQQVSTPPVEQVVWVTKEAKKGEKRNLLLPDGTQVILNSGSKIVFPERFQPDGRKVSLVGEAFFDVIKDEQSPFTISTGSLTTTVLGTSFNINAYPERETVEVALVSGEVRVHIDDRVAESLKLVPDESATYDKHDSTLKKSLFDQKILGWRKGILYFKNADEDHVIRTLENWYGVDIELQNSRNQIWDLNASFDNQSLNAVLESLSYIANFEYTITNKEVIIKYE